MSDDGLQSDVAAALQALREGQLRLEGWLARHPAMPVAALESLNTHFQRNFLPNDSAAMQKLLMATWRNHASGPLGPAELMESGFRVFSQNDEDGILLRLFTAIGTTNRCVIEIGSNCSGSAVGIPENMSANLIVNHGWHGAVIEMDPLECERMRYFFAREHSTRHFHWQREGANTYLSPLIIQQAVSPENINGLLQTHVPYAEPDLVVIDIDAGDYAVVRELAVRPRVLVVEFERRFRDRHAVVQADRADLSRHWQQSGTASLPAWNKLLGSRGYSLCAIGAAGFNAFFVRDDAVKGKVSPLDVGAAFDHHPVFASAEDAFWLMPDETWHAV